MGALFVTGLLSVHLLAGMKRIVRWLSGVYATTPALVVLLSLSVILGLIPQFPQGTANEPRLSTFFTSLGWYQMTTSWPFVLISFLYAGNPGPDHIEKNSTETAMARYRLLPESLRTVYRLSGRYPR